MRRLIVNNTEYRLEQRAEILGIKLIRVSWDSSYRYIPLSWRRFKKFVKSGGQL